MPTALLKSSPTPGAHKSSGRERKASIIAASASLFAQKGFTGTTTREIAKTAGISEALLFKHFPTKRALYAAILAERSQLFSQLMASIEEAADKRDDVRVFTLIASFCIHRGSDPSLLRLLLFSALEGHELSDMFFKNRHRVFYEFLAGYIARRTREGAFRRVGPLLAAQSFIGMTVYHQLLYDVFRVPPHCSPEEAIAGYVEVFLDGLRPPSIRRVKGHTTSMSRLKRHPLDPRRHPRPDASRARYLTRFL